MSPAVAPQRGNMHNGLVMWLLGFAATVGVSTVGVIYSGLRQDLNQLRESDKVRASNVAVVDNELLALNKRLDRIEAKLDLILDKISRRP